MPPDVRRSRESAARELRAQLRHLAPAVTVTPRAGLLDIDGVGRLSLDKRATVIRVVRDHLGSRGLTDHPVLLRGLGDDSIQIAPSMSELQAAATPQVGVPLRLRPDCDPGIPDSVGLVVLWADGPAPAAVLAAVTCVLGSRPSWSRVVVRADRQFSSLGLVQAWAVARSAGAAGRTRSFAAQVDLGVGAVPEQYAWVTETTARTLLAMAGAERAERVVRNAMWVRDSVDALDRFAARTMASTPAGRVVAVLDVAGAVLLAA